MILSSLLRLHALSFITHSRYKLATLALLVASVAIASWQWHELTPRQAALQSAQHLADEQLHEVEALLAQSQTQQFESAQRSVLPALAEQSRIATELHAKLQVPQLQLGDLNLSRPVLDKTQSVWKQEITLRMSGPFTVLRSALFALPESVSNVQLHSLRLSREGQQEGIVECEAVLQARYRYVEGQDAPPKD